jgi:RluA family pseudouridine synthase
VRVLYRDENLIAVDKPAGVLTVPGRGVEGAPLIDEVRAEVPEAMPVHRLDRDTSGVVVFALGKESHKALNAAFEARKVEKTYLALVKGDFAEAQKVDLPLAEGRKGSMRVAKRNEKGAQSAVTQIEPRERYGKYTLCTCTPKTGRTHQIRVHLAAVGHPLAIDPRYGEELPLRVGELWSGAPDPDTVVISRTPLHAFALRIPHPTQKGWIAIEAPLADDIARAVDLLRAHRRYN